MDVLTVQKRNPEIKAKKLRHSGLVPGIVFGGHLQDSIPVQMDDISAQKLVRSKREGSRLQLKLDGHTIPVQIKEKEIDTLRNEIIHISFQALSADQKVNSVIHVIPCNSDIIAGTLEKLLLEIPYASFPADMIDSISIDLEGLPVGTVLTVGDIPELKNEKLEVQVDMDSIVLRINDKIRLEKQTSEEAAE